VVEISVGDDFSTWRNFTLEMVYFGAFSVAKEAAVAGTCPPVSLPNTTLLKTAAAECSDRPDDGFRDDKPTASKQYKLTNRPTLRC